MLMYLGWSKIPLITNDFAVLTHDTFNHAMIVLTFDSDQFEQSNIVDIEVKTMDISKEIYFFWTTLEQDLKVKIADYIKNTLR